MKKISQYGRNITLAAIFLIPFTPLIVSDALFFPFIVGKAIFFRVLVEVAFFGWLFLALTDLRYRPRNSAVFSVFFLFVLWLFIANIFSVNSPKALWGNFERMDGWINTAHLFVFFVVFGSVSAVGINNNEVRGDDLGVWRLGSRPLEIFWLISLAVSVIVSVIAFFGINNIPGVFSGARAAGTLGNPIYIAAYSLIHIFAAALFFAKIRKYSSSWSYLFIAIMLINMTMLLFSGTRGAMLGLVAGSITTAFLLFMNEQKENRLSIKQAGRAALFAGGILAFAFFVFALSRLPLLREQPVFSRIASITFAEGKTRLTIWKIALEGAKERPLLGWGQEGYNYVFNKYYDPSLFGQEKWFDRAHNDYLDWLVAGGIPALLLYISLFWFAIRMIWQFDRRQPRAILIGLIVAYGVHSLFVFNIISSLFLFVAVLAYAHCLYLQDSLSSAKLQPLPNFSKRHFGLAAALAMFLTMTVFSVNSRTVKANAELMQALGSNNTESATSHFESALKYNFGRQEIREQMVLFAARAQAESNIDVRAKVKIVRAAVTEMRKQIHETPSDARAYLFRAIAYQAAGDLNGAWNDFEKARELSPRKQTFLLEQGRLAYGAGYRQQAMELFARAYELDDLFSETANYAAAGLVMVGRIKEGQALLQKHFGTPFTNHPLIQRVYRELP